MGAGKQQRLRKACCKNASISFLHRKIVDDFKTDVRYFFYTNVKDSNGGIFYE